MAYYAWSPIRGGTADKPVNIARGAKVTKDGLGVDDANWNALVESGAVREKEFPAPADYDGSVIDYLRDRLQEAQSLSAVDEEEAASELAAVSAANAPEAAAAMPPAQESSGKK
jgi:hypothetical protein